MGTLLSNTQDAGVVDEVEDAKLEAVVDKVNEETKETLQAVLNDTEPVIEAVFEDIKQKTETVLVTGVEVIFENVEVVYIPAEYIHKLEMRGIRKDKYSIQQSNTTSMRNMLVVKWFDLTVHQYGDTKEIIERCSLYSDDQDMYDGYTRLFQSRDITGVEVHFSNGDSETYTVNYSEGEHYSDPNDYQQNTPVISKDVPNGVNVCVASPNGHKVYGK